MLMRFSKSFISGNLLKKSEILEKDNILVMGLSLYSASFMAGENFVNVGNTSMDGDKELILCFAIRHYKFVSRSHTF